MPKGITTNKNMQVLKSKARKTRPTLDIFKCLIRLLLQNKQKFNQFTCLISHDVIEHRYRLMLYTTMSQASENLNPNIQSKRAFQSRKREEGTGLNFEN